MLTNNNKKELTNQFCLFGFDFFFLNNNNKL